MKHNVLLVLMAAASAAASAQTPAKPPVATAKPASTTAKPAVNGQSSAISIVKLPPGVPPVKGMLKTAFTLRYQEIKIGTGADAEPGKMYKVHYTGYRAADGVKFDSSFDHPGQPVKDKDGKPVLGADGKPEMGPPQPMTFPQGMGRLIPGFDQGFAGMKIGGKRRLFIPWQLAYGMRTIPDHGPDHPGIPAKSDLIFDVELVDVAEMPAPPTRPGMGGMPGGVPPRPVPPPTPGAPAVPAQQNPANPSSAAPGAASAPSTSGAPVAAPASTAPATSAPATTTAPTAPATSTPPQPK
ncbi:MAG: FKBP-type peptidyl-prolyl cis-trans isomerase [Terracidiphilus sp.]